MKTLSSQFNVSEKLAEVQNKFHAAQKMQQSQTLLMWETSLWSYPWTEKSLSAQTTFTPVRLNKRSTKGTQRRIGQGEGSFSENSSYICDLFCDIIWATLTFWSSARVLVLFYSSCLIGLLKPFLKSMYNLLKPPYRNLWISARSLCVKQWDLSFFDIFTNLNAAATRVFCASLHKLLVSSTRAVFISHLKVGYCKVDLPDICGLKKSDKRACWNFFHLFHTRHLTEKQMSWGKYKRTNELPSKCCWSSFHLILVFSFFGGTLSGGDTLSWEYLLIPPSKVLYIYRIKQTYLLYGLFQMSKHVSVRCTGTSGFGPCN